MPHLPHEIKIMPEHQPYLNVLGLCAHVGDVVRWREINTAYKKRALIVHPDKGGSENAFYALTNAFKALENAVDNGLLGLNDPTTEIFVDRRDPFGGFAHKDQLKEEMRYQIREMRDLGIKIPNKIIITINGQETTCYIDFKAAMEEEEEKRRMDAYQMHVFLLGTAIFSLGAGMIGRVFMGLAAKSHPSQNRMTSLCGSGLIVGGGLLIINSFFERPKKLRANNERQNSKEKTGQESLVNTGR